MERFSQRELNISLLDARAGSPPTAAELLRRHAGLASTDVLTQYLSDWEIWSAQTDGEHLFLSRPLLLSLAARQSILACRRSPRFWTSAR